MRKWRIEDSEELYNIKGWGVNYFGINEKGHAYVSPRKDGVQVDLKEVIDDLNSRDITAPVLLRFPDILDNRIEKTSDCFNQAAKEYDFKAEHFIIYPIKVNQMRPVVEEIISHGKKFNLGLEAGSKPELHAVLATNMDSDSLIICNGHKDQNFIELALLAQKMGKRVFLVVEKMPELITIARTAEKLGVRPNLGIRIKLAASGTGKWQESGGDASKFGLNSSELLEALHKLDEVLTMTERAQATLKVRSIILYKSMSTTAFTPLSMQRTKTIFPTPTSSPKAAVRLRHTTLCSLSM